MERGDPRAASLYGEDGPRRLDRVVAVATPGEELTSALLAAGDDHQVALSRAEAKDLRAETGQVVLARTGRHQFDPATGRGKRHRP
jgi:hypothetical protein